MDKQQQVLSVTPAQFVIIVGIIFLLAASAHLFKTFTGRAIIRSIFITTALYVFGQFLYNLILFYDSIAIRLVLLSLGAALAVFVFYKGVIKTLARLKNYQKRLAELKEKTAELNAIFPAKLAEVWNLPLSKLSGLSYIRKQSNRIRDDIEIKYTVADDEALSLCDIKSLLERNLI